ncbi:hypothetical protein Ccrd_014837, partial [Cynara cardunculus var. scolymus]
KKKAEEYLCPPLRKNSREGEPESGEAERGEGEPERESRRGGAQRGRAGEAERGEGEPERESRRGRAGVRRGRAVACRRGLSSSACHRRRRPVAVADYVVGREQQRHGGETLRGQMRERAALQQRRGGESVNQEIRLISRLGFRRKRLIRIDKKRESCFNFQYPVKVPPTLVMKVSLLLTYVQENKGLELLKTAIAKAGYTRKERVNIDSQFSFYPIQCVEKTIKEKTCNALLLRMAMLYYLSGEPNWIKTGARCRSKRLAKHSQKQASRRFWEDVAILDDNTRVEEMNNNHFSSP